jgi:hypothetical protein
MKFCVDPRVSNVHILNPSYGNGRGNHKNHSQLGLFII